MSASPSSSAAPSASSGGSGGGPASGNRKPAIVVRGLRKSYGEIEAVAGVDLTVNEGEVFALLGPNGAGKTTIVEILEGYRSRDAGDVSVLGFDPARGERAMKERIGIVLQSTGVEPYLTVAEVIDMCRGYYPRPRPLDELLGLVDLREQARVRVDKLSGGQRRRLDLAVGLAGDPDLLFRDEPTTGFDPGARRQAWEVVRKLTGLGKTVLLTTHFMDEAQYLANRLAVMVAGRIVAEGSPEEVVARRSTATIVRIRLPDGAPPLPSEFRSATAGVAPNDGEASGGVAPNGGEVSGGVTEFRTEEPTAFLNRLTGWALASGLVFEELTVARPSLEDTYLALTGEAQEPTETAA
jgi:ABC-2 type transport system ATP-binding protein